VTSTAVAPDYAEPFEAWRVWRVVGHGTQLTLASIVKRTLWPPCEPLAAECLRPTRLLDWLRRRQPHPAPAPSCECGIYAGTLDVVRRYLTDTLPDARARVIGRVALWGTVVECEWGYRASYAYPLALWVPVPGRGRTWSGAESVAAGLERYRVPVRLLPSDRIHAPAFERAFG
jgi:hypothetical protein